LKNVKCGMRILLLFLVNNVMGQQPFYQYFDERMKIPVGGAPPTLQEEQAWSEVFGEKGETIKIKCPVEGQGNIMYRWWKDGEEIDSLWSWFRLSSGAQKTLKIKKLSTETVGRYKCRGTNGFGSAEFLFQVTYTGQQSLYAGEQKVLLDGGMGNVTVEEGFPIKLSCTLQFYEKLVMKWLKKRGTASAPQAFKVGDLSSQHFQVLEEPFLDHYTITDGYQIQNGQFLYTLSVLSAQREDAGSYLCVVFLPDPTKVMEAFDYKMATVEVIPNNNLKKTDDLSQSRSDMLTVLAVLLPLVFVLLLITIVLAWKTNLLRIQGCCDTTNRSEEMEKVEKHEIKKFLDSVPSLESKSKHVSWVYTSNKY